jgi:hypothetical protein
MSRAIGEDIEPRLRQLIGGQPVAAERPGQK